MNLEEKVSLAKKNIRAIQQIMSDCNSSVEEVVKDVNTDYSLRFWAGTQRRFIVNGTLSDEEVEVYQEHSFDFGIRPLKWDEWFLLAKEYCEKHKVSKIPSPTFSEEGYALDVWFNRQIRNRRKLPPDQLKKIESIKPSEKKGYVIEYKGKTYHSAKEFSSSVRIPYTVVCSCARIGMSGEEILSFYKAVLREEKFVFKGQEYSNLLEFAIKYSFPIDLWSISRDVFSVRIAEMIDRENKRKRNAHPEKRLMSADQMFADEMPDNTSDITNQQENAVLHTSIDSSIIWVGGKPYNSKTEIAKAFGISPATIYNKLRKGWTIEQIVGLEGYVPPKVVFRGKTYDSELTLADAFGVSFTTYKSRIAHGWSQEEALGLALRIPEDPELNGKTFSIDGMLPGIRTIFETNVFCVLGIPANSSKRQALDSKDKLEKYNKIGAAEAYKTEFDFPFIQKPNREIGHVQVIFASFGALSDRWLWFSTEKYIQYWNRRIIDRQNSEKTEYDKLLTGYYQVLITDPGFSKKHKWDMVLKAIDALRLMGDHDLYVYISDHLGEEDLKRYNKKMVVSSFREAIIKPLTDNIHFAEREFLLAAIPYWRSSTVSFANYMLDECIQSALSLVNNEVMPIMNEVSYVPDHSNPSSEETGKVQEVAEHFLDGKYKLVVALAEVLEGQEMFPDIIKKKMKDSLWEAGFIVWKGGHDEAAARIFSDIYMFCEKKYKRQIKNTFSLELLIDIPESEFSTDEKKKIADKHDEKKNYELAFKWYRLAADAGNADAQYKLGTYYEYGYGVLKNETTAYAWYIKAADNGNGMCLRKLASEYYRGTAYCKKDTEKAKYYWIRLFVMYPYAHNEETLNRYFPNWKKENNKAFDDLKYKKKTQLLSIADRGIAAAAYWLGEGLFGNNTLMTLRSILGYETDKDKARRWFLIAALCDFSPAIVKLENYYGINAKEAVAGPAMFECANRYSDDSSEQGKDLKFYWLSKAVEFGYEGACNNLGVCYDDGVGTDRDYEKANELYLRAIQYNENAGAYYNYGVNIYFGNGVEKDEEKAKEYLLKACEKGNDPAEAFLRKNYDIATLFLDFDQFKDQIIYSANGLRIDFCGLKVIGSTIRFKFWVHNSSGRQYNIWLKDTVIDGDKTASFKKIGNYATEGKGFSVVKIDRKLETVQSILTFSIEVDDENDVKLFITKLVQLKVSTVNKTLECIIIENAEKESLYPLLKQSIDEEDDDNEDDDEEDEDDEYYPFANEYFKAQVIYDQDGLRVEFGGFDVKDGEVYVHIWSNNTSNVIYKLWLKNIVVDGKQTEEYKNAGICSPGASWEGHLVKIEEIDLDVYYDLEFTVEINDQNNKVIALAKRVNVHIDFSNEEIRLSLSDDESEENGQDYSFANEDFQDMVVYDSNKFRVEFGGFEVQGEDVCIKIWSKNTSTEAYKLWLKDIVVDGDRIREYREIATSMPDNSWECNNVPIEELDLDTYYDVEFTVVISDLQDMIVGMAKRVSARIDFSEEEISAILSDHVDYEDDEEADADDGASASDSLFVENSFCMRNEERDGLEIYFPDIPNEYVRATMKEQGWRWHRQKGCWYVRENAERAELARRITGSEIKG